VHARRCVSAGPVTPKLKQLTRGPSYSIDADLQFVEHDCLRYTLASQRGRWRFRGPAGETLYIPVTGSFDSDHSGALRVAACAGLGIVYLPRFYLAEAIERGALVRILPGFSPPPIDIQAVYPGRKLLAPKTRACLDFLARELPKRMARCEAVARSGGR
jgi:DNA-binding transcriptional LysR family regulator